MKLKLNKRKLIGLAIMAGIILVSAFFVYTRGIQLKDCYMAEYDLRRDTHFRVLTGRCTAEGKDGGQVYVDQLRAFGSDSHQDVDVDHGN